MEQHIKNKYWIKASEELPKDDSDILFMNNDELVCLGWFESIFNKFYEYDNHTAYHTGDVIAWCPIPEFDLY